MSITTSLPQCGTCAAKDQEIARLTAERDAAEFDTIWGIYKREGIERRMPHLSSDHVTIVIDLDNMHASNEEHGHSGVDWRVNTIMALLRADDDVLIGRWQHGDELVMFPRRRDASGMAHRLLSELFNRSLSATMAIVDGTNQESVAIGLVRIEEAKRVGQRGRVFVAQEAQ